ncbi:YjzD family protein [Sporosarcina sp. ACRSM]|uniref:DUF2929 family protein n=1 Tax=Sporosarcina sp. ACRSM TaxID=2918216 RepID=UPI001EF60D59|nr:DUF2929 family protein [Sporosarcina sp. ACRSM]MCG7334287.1 YjzD family protein [Sporosarcina sp. ACRSM]
MQFIMTFIWSFLLISMLNYVSGSIANVSFEFLPGVIISLIVSVFVFLVGESFPEGEVADH